LFGRVPERIYYLPDEGRDLEPPLREAWSINTPPLAIDGRLYLGDVEPIRR